LKPNEEEDYSKQGDLGFGAPEGSAGQEVSKSMESDLQNSRSMESAVQEVSMSIKSDLQTGSEPAETAENPCFEGEEGRETGEGAGLQVNEKCGAQVNQKCGQNTLLSNDSKAAAAEISKSMESDLQNSTSMKSAVQEAGTSLKSDLLNKEAGKAAAAAMKQELESIDGGLVFHEEFYPVMRDYMEKEGLDGEYFKWLYEHCCLKKPNSIRAMFYRLFRESDITALYRNYREKREEEQARRAAEEAARRVECPVCGTAHTANECPGCGFERRDIGNGKETARAQAIYGLSASDRAAWEDECEKVLLSDKPFDEKMKERREIDGRFKIPCVT
jgi:hypothetical protein